MQLEQLNLTYSINEDRLLLRIGLKDSNATTSTEVATKQEVQIFLTRRILINLWPSIIDMMSAQVRINRPEAAFASTDLVQMEHQSSLAAINEKGNFNQSYKTENRVTLNGDAPILADTIQFNLSVNGPISMSFSQQNGQTIEMKLDTQLMHGFCKLLQDAEKIANWGLNLHLLNPSEMIVPANRLN